MFSDLSPNHSAHEVIASIITVDAVRHEFTPMNYTFNMTDTWTRTDETDQQMMLPVSAGSGPLLVLPVRPSNVWIWRSLSIRQRSSSHLDENNTRRTRESQSEKSLLKSLLHFRNTLSQQKYVEGTVNKRTNTHSKHISKNCFLPNFT